MVKADIHIPYPLKSYIRHDTHYPKTPDKPYQGITHHPEGGVIGLFGLMGAHDSRCTESSSDKKHCTTYGCEQAKKEYYKEKTNKSMPTEAGDRDFYIKRAAGAQSIVRACERTSSTNGTFGHCESKYTTTGNEAYSVGENNCADDLGLSHGLGVCPAYFAEDLCMTNELLVGCPIRPIHPVTAKFIFFII